MNISSTRQIQTLQPLSIMMYPPSLTQRWKDYMKVQLRLILQIEDGWGEVVLEWLEQKDHFVFSNFFQNEMHFVDFYSGGTLLVPYHYSNIQKNAKRRKKLNQEIIRLHIQQYKMNSGVCSIGKTLKNWEKWNKVALKEQIIYFSGKFNAILIKSIISQTKGYQKLRQKGRTECHI